MEINRDMKSVHEHLDLKNTWEIELILHLLF